MKGNPVVAAQILDHLGLQANQIVPAELQGIANDTWLCGDWVVRVCKDTEFLEDLFTESVAAPVAYVAGVRSAEPIHFQLERLGDIPPFSVYRRIVGKPLSRVGNLADPESFFRAYGAELRKVHEIRAVEDPNHYLDEAWELEPESLRESAVRYGLMDEVERLLGAVGLVEKVFVHQDIHADNVLVDEGGLPVFLDWGDAGFGDPAADIRYVPAQYLGDVLKGYGGGDLGLVCRAKLHLFDQFVYCQKTGRSYGQYGQSNLKAIQMLLKQ